ncbi:MAG: MFS transporter [Promethearchaeota archaeon]
MEEIATQETYKSYMVFFIGQLFSLLGSLVVFFVIFIWIWDVTGSAIMLSIANFIFLIPTLVIFPFAGVISDRYDRKKIILVSDSLQALFTTIMALFFIFDFTIVWVVFLFLGLRSVCQGFHMPTISAIVPSMIPRDKLSRINGVRFMFLGIVQFIGPAVGATLLFLFPIKYILWIDVITFFIALFPLIKLKAPRIQRDNTEEERNSFGREITEGLRIIRTIPGLFVIILLAMLLMLLSQPSMTLAPMFIKSIHGGNDFTLALNNMILQGGMIVGSVVVSIKKHWKNKIRTLFIGIMLINIGYLIYAIAPIGIFIMIQVGLLIMGLIMPIIDVIVMTVIQTTVPLDKMGRVSSILNLLMMIATPIGAILAGPLSLVMGVSNLYIICAITSIVVTAIPYMSKGIRQIDYDKPILSSIE